MTLPTAIMMGGACGKAAEAWQTWVARAMGARAKAAETWQTCVARAMGARAKAAETWQTCEARAMGARAKAAEAWQACRRFLSAVHRMSAAAKLLYTLWASVFVMACGALCIFPLWKLLAFGVVLVWALQILAWGVRSRGTVAFFHPYCAAGGGGERVLWCAAWRARHAVA